MSATGIVGVSRDAPSLTFPHSVTLPHTHAPCLPSINARRMGARRPHLPTHSHTLSHFSHFLTPISPTPHPGLTLAARHASGSSLWFRISFPSQPQSNPNTSHTSSHLTPTPPHLLTPVPPTPHPGSMPAARRASGSWLWFRSSSPSQPRTPAASTLVWEAAALPTPGRQGRGRLEGGEVRKNLGDGGLNSNKYTHSLDLWCSLVKPLTFTLVWAAAALLPLLL